MQRFENWIASPEQVQADNAKVQQLLEKMRKAAVRRDPDEAEGQEV
jgi:hypothetical protein